jgi:hypothetical protein
MADDYLGQMSSIQGQLRSTKEGPGSTQPRRPLIATARSGSEPWSLPWVA